MNLKDQLSYLLDEHRMNASQFSKEVGISKSTISDWLAGSNPKSILQVKKVANYFEVSLDYLCFGESKRNSEQLSNYIDEINAGVFEVVLRRIKK